MKLDNKYLVYIQLSTLFLLSGGSVWAAEAPMICAVTQTLACQKGGDCQSGSAIASEMPALLKISPAKNEIVRMIVIGEIDRDDIEKICNSYMNIRESMIMSEGDMARWVEK